jgi:TFIIF-interacting CTD phosphatase-like protein
MASKILPKLRVVFDLDDCLVHTNQCFIGKVTSSKGGMPKTKVHTLSFLDSYNFVMNGVMIERPHLLTGLEMIKDSKKADIFLYTAGSKDYAEKAVALIDPNRKYFSKIWSRSDCTGPNGSKDLKVMKEDFIPERTILIDDRYYNFALQPENGYLIKQFRPKSNETGIGDSLCMKLEHYEDDDHLLTACEFVTKELLHEEDVRVKLEKKFSLRALYFSKLDQ